MFICFFHEHLMLHDIIRTKSIAIYKKEPNISMTTTSRTTLLRNKTFLNIRRRLRMEINPQTWIFKYQIRPGKNISFGGVFLKLATVVFLAPFSQYWKQSASLDEQKQFICHCQNSHAPVRSLYLEIILKFWSNCQSYLSSRKEMCLLSKCKPY